MSLSQEKAGNKAKLLSQVINHVLCKLLPPECKGSMYQIDKKSNFVLGIHRLKFPQKFFKHQLYPLQSQYTAVQVPIQGRQSGLKSGGCTLGRDKKFRGNFHPKKPICYIYFGAGQKKWGCMTDCMCTPQFDAGQYGIHMTYMYCTYIRSI